MLTRPNDSFVLEVRILSLSLSLSVYIIMAGFSMAKMDEFVNAFPSDYRKWSVQIYATIYKRDNWTKHLINALL